MSFKILLVEDEASIASFIKKGLTEEGMEVTVAYDGKQGLTAFKAGSFDLVILDVMLPHMNGRDLCYHIRNEERSAVPVIMLTALNDTAQVIKGLEAGADDYIPKPFKFDELLARMHALIRRKNNFYFESKETFNHQGVQLNGDTKQVTYKGEPIPLTAREFLVLEFFMRNPNKVFSRMDILEKVWGINFDTSTNIIEVYINYLRNKIDKRFDLTLIETIKGLGYILRS